MNAKLESLLKISAASRNSTEMFAGIFNELVEFFNITDEEQERFYVHVWKQIIKKGKIDRKLTSAWVLARKLQASSKKKPVKNGGQPKKTSRSNPARASINKLLGGKK